MNGRIYDPTIGRFLQADPIIQDASDGQNFNRYSYVSNNPLSLTDPSGFSWWTKWRRTIFALAVALVIGYFDFSALAAQGTFGFSTTTGGLFAGNGFANAVAAGFASGGISGGNLTSALQGAFFAGLTFGLASGLELHGAADFLSGKHLGQIALHAALGCGQAAAAGGSCRAGAISGFSSALASPLMPGATGNGISVQRFIGNAVIGAIASRLGGGDAIVGAISSGMSYLFNEGAASGDKSSPTGPSGKAPNERARIAEDSARKLLEEQGYKFLNRQVTAVIEGLPERRYDLVMMSPDGRVTGIEVKSTVTGVFKLNAQQVNFDAHVVSLNGAYVPSLQTTIVQTVYLGIDFGVVDAAWSTQRLANRLKEMGIETRSEVVVPPWKK